MAKRNLITDVINNNIVDYEPPKLKKLQEKFIKRVKHYIHLIAGHSLSGTKVSHVLNDALGSSGKLIRPRMVLLCAAFGELFIEKFERICMLAAMVELTHLASLIHDDIVDDAPYRRGEISIQSKYGKDAAVYAGDFLMARIYYYEAIEHLNESAAILSKAVEYMCLGEIGQDICKFREDVTIKEYFENISGKTAALFKTACHIGAYEAGCSKELIEKMELFGENLGFMFQLRDDLLDFTSDKGEIGKETHKDFRNGIYTLPVLMALRTTEGSKALIPIMHENAKKRLNHKEIAQMEEYVIHFGGVEATHQEIRKLSRKNKEILDTLDQSNEAVWFIRKLISILEV